MTDLHGKVAIVTGAGRGLGRSMASALVAAGAAVTVAARTGTELDAFVDEAKAAGGLGLGVAAHAAYSASKAGVIAFTRSMAVEWARHGIQVNAIAPGYFATPLNSALRADTDALAKVTRAIPARRMGRPQELEPWLLLLAGSASDFMTGEVIVIDGGQSVR